MYDKMLLYVSTYLSCSAAGGCLSRDYVFTPRVNTDPARAANVD